MRFAFIDAWKAVYPILLICRLLEVSRAGYYEWRGRKPSKRAREDVRLGALLAAFHAASGGTYGSPRLHEDLREANERVSRKRVIRLMRAEIQDCADSGGWPSRSTGPLEDGNMAAAMMTADWGGGCVVLEDAPGEVHWIFDGSTIFMGPGPNDPEYSTFLTQTAGRSLADGDAVRFWQHDRALAGFSVGLPYPLTSRSANLADLPLRTGRLRWVGEHPPHPIFSQATLLPGVWLWWCGAGRPAARWQIAPDMSLLLDVDHQVCGLALESIFERLPQPPDNPRFEALALEAYALHFKFEWDEWSPQEAARAATLQSAMQTISGAEPIVELLRWCH